MTTDKLFMLLGCIASGSGVAFGAFGAHALKKHLSSDMLAVYQTGVQYQLTHGIALLCVGLALRHYDSSAITTSGWLLTIGIILFSGSLYILSVSSIRYIGILTPLGGVAFIAGWIMLAVGILRA